MSGDRRTVCLLDLLGIASIFKLSWSATLHFMKTLDFSSYLERVSRGGPEGV